MINKPLTRTLLVVLITLVWPVQASTIALFSDINSTSNPTSDRNQLLTNLLGAGTSVLISDQTSDNAGPSDSLNTLYNSLSGTSSTLVTSELDSSLLSGLDLLFLELGAYASNPYSVDEIFAINNFIGSGGNLGIVAEPVNTGLDSVNNLLSDLNTTFNLGTHTNLTGEGTGPTSVLPTTLTVGVVNYSLLTFNPISGGIAAIQQNSLTGVAFESNSAVPVPAAVWLFGTALVGFIGVSRRRKVA